MESRLREIISIDIKEWLHNGGLDKISSWEATMVYIFLHSPIDETLFPPLLTSILLLETTAFIDFISYFVNSGGFLLLLTPVVFLSMLGFNVGVLYLFDWKIKGEKLRKGDIDAVIG